MPGRFVEIFTHAGRECDTGDMDYFHAARIAP